MNKTDFTGSVVRFSRFEGRLLFTMPIAHLDGLHCD